MAPAPRVLIVEDDPVQRDVLRLIVARFFPAARVTAVATGYDALVTYQHDGADVLILDHRLPDVLGSALLAYLRDAGMTIPTIIVSGVLPRDAVLADERTSFLHKPMLVPEFVSMMASFLSAPGDITSTT